MSCIALLVVCRKLVAPTVVKLGHPVAAANHTHLACGVGGKEGGHQNRVQNNDAGTKAGTLVFSATPDVRKQA